MKKGAIAVSLLTGVLGAIILGLSLYYFFSFPPLTGGVLDKDKASAMKDLFEAVVTKTLAPIFNTLVAAVLAWVFGKPVFEALAERIRVGRQWGPSRNDPTADHVS